MQPSADAFVVTRLRAAGAVIIGKTAMHELAAGLTTISSLTGATRNPYDPSRVPGGSSGGTGAAVAASFAAAGMGTDTCGSIRVPAAHQNLFGLRATHGLLSRTGLMPLSLSQDVPGPLAHSVTDLAILLDAIVGTDPEDALTCSARSYVPASYLDALEPEGLKNARLGVVRELFGDAPEDEEVAGVVLRALEAMRSAGAELVEVSIAGLRERLHDTNVADYELKFDLADYLARHPGAPVRSLGEILARGLYHEQLEERLQLRNRPAERDTADYQSALQRRAALREAVLQLLKEQHLDVLAYPTIRHKPAPIGQAQTGGEACLLSAATGLPAIAIPAGFTEDELPVAVELLGGPYAELTLLRLAYSWEQTARPRRAPFSTPALIDGRVPSPLLFKTLLLEVATDPPKRLCNRNVHL